MPALTRLQRLLGHDPNAVVSIAGVAVSVALPTAVRWALHPVLGDALWFATYYPAILAATLFLGWRLGLLTLLLSALVADYVFIPPPQAISLRATDIAAVLVFLFSGGLILITAALLRQAIQRLNRSMDIQGALNRELQHRVNNNLAVVQALAAQTVRTSLDLPAFSSSFQARLAALSKAQTVLSAGEWRRCDFPALPTAALEPFMGHGHIALQGPACWVPADSCVPLVLALHELATNATKHGALSVPDGHVSVRWRLRESSRAPELVLEWEESHGPLVKPPSRRGLGSRLLAQQAGLADVQVRYEPEGLQCTIVVQEVTVTSTAPQSAPSALGASLLDPTGARGHRGVA